MCRGGRRLQTRVRYNNQCYARILPNIPRQSKRAELHLQQRFLTRQGLAFFVDADWTKNMAPSVTAL